MLYQDTQYLASFIRRIVPEIILDHGGEAFSQHESYLPNGGVIDEYLMLYIGRKDQHGIEIYEDDKVAWHGVHATGGQVAGEDVVTYDEAQACFKLGNMYFVEDANHFNDLFIDWESLEVVGHTRIQG